MKKHLFLVACVLAGNVSAATWKPPERLLHAVGYVESAHNVFTCGDNGNSLGEYQLSEAAWLDVSAWRKAHDQPTYPYETHVWNRKVSYSYAADYLAILQRALRKRLNRNPTPAEIYAAYNMGLASFARCQFQLANVNPVTARKCQQIDLMVGRR